MDNGALSSGRRDGSLGRRRRRARGRLMRSNSPSSSWLRRLAAIAAWLVVTAALVAVARSRIPPENVCPDFIQFWTAASLLADGSNPYDPALQAAIQQELGWNKAVEGLGVYDFLPYYYPPWLGLAFTVLLPLGYPLAKMVWLVAGGEMLIASAVLLKNTIRGVSLPVAVVVIASFGFSIKAVAMGQVAPLVLLLVALAWRFVDRGRDGAAGAVLALLTIKPQLTILLLLAVLGWSARRRRWGLWRGFAVTLAALALASTIAFPGWPAQLLAATRVTPMPTAYYPGLGTTWLVALGAAGVEGHLLHLAYAAVVVPLLLAMLRMTLQGSRPLEDIVAVALIAPFFVAPYARPYDYPVLLVPALILIGSRLPELSRATMAAALVVLPSLHILWLTANYETPVVGVRRPEFTYFWIPLLVGLSWLACGDARREGGLERRPQELR